ncbi:uncharacterized protein ATNIH1004_000763 [Aspergillus tanneri]|uniref:Cyclase n=1 Tax=Aspergillus tanneri TaxID=1220188 RepID=A0A5M9MXQ7_9EURO|nr:uncharacterized protein ATNIH1004_000763 [Aspergillus tanneri]KAA8651865.1 hypothetical protein ATNIH1004_000763 [Aspergillus tanneri]
MSVQDPNQLPWDPNCTRFPSRAELPKIPNAPDDAAWLGRLNLLTPQRVKAAAGEIRTGEMVRLDLPLNVPETPAFGRESFQHNIKCLVPNVAYDDTYTLNTQSGTQWDGFRHFAHLSSQTFYNGTKSTDIEGPTANHRGSIHHWAQHGIAGRGILLDYRHYAETHSIPYDAYSAHAISLSELQACAAAQGLDLRPESQGGDVKVGDILMIRSGFVQRYHEFSSSTERNSRAANLQWAGLKQEDPMLDWLHDCYFAALCGDSPTFECWPSVRGELGYLHQYILALWGMPLGEMWDLEDLARRCRRLGKWTFFVTSAPANVAGGVGSHANATAIL